MTIKVLLPKLKGKFYLLILRDQGYYRYLFRRTPEQLVKAFSDTLGFYRNPKPRDNWKRNSSEFLNRSFGSSYLSWNLQVFDVVNPNSTNLFEDKLDNLAREDMFESFMYHVMYKVKTYYETKESLPPGFKLLKRVTKKTSNINIELYGEKSNWIVWQGTREEFIDKFCTTEVQEYLTKHQFDIFHQPINPQPTGLSEATTEIDLTKNLVCFYDSSRELDIIHVNLTDKNGYIPSQLPRVKERFLFLAQENTEEDTSFFSKQISELFDKHTEFERIEEEEKNKRFNLQRELEDKKELEELERFFTTG